MDDGLTCFGSKGWQLFLYVLNSKIEMVSKMRDCDTPERWDKNLHYDDNYEWDHSFTFYMYEDVEEFTNSEMPDVINLLNSGLSRSEALDVISKIEGESDEYERLMNDLHCFDSIGEYLKYAKLAYNAKTYLALTLIDVEDGEEINDPSPEGESSETRKGLNEYDHSENHIVIDRGQLEDFMVSGSSGPSLLPAGASSPLGQFLDRTPGRKGGVSSPWDWATAPGGEGSYFLNRRLICRPAGDAGSNVTGRRPEGVQVILHPNEIGWGGFNGPGDYKGYRVDLPWKMKCAVKDLRCKGEVLIVTMFFYKLKNFLEIVNASSSNCV